jgi:arginase
MSDILPFTINNLRCKIGQKKLGVEQGGDYLLKLFTMKNFTVNNFEFNAMVDYKPVYEHILSLEQFCINLGGDHSVGAVTVQPLLDKYHDDLLVIWIDAHADVNTWETSPSKNIHGMPIAPLLGLMDHWWTDSSTSNQFHKLKSDNLLYVGIRDLDPGETELIAKSNIKYWTHYSDQVGAWIKAHPAGHIHISLDIDGIDPKYMPSTGTLATNGLDLSHILDLIDLTCEKLTSFDLVEINPFVGSDQDIQLTLTNCKYILDHLIKIKFSQ